MAEPNGEIIEPTLKGWYKGAGLAVRGTSVFIVLALLAVVGTILYSGWRTQEAVEQSATRTEKAVEKIVQNIVAVQLIAANEHVGLRRSQDRTSCILTMGTDERTWFRKNYQPGSFIRSCPWIGELDGR